jgi:hypothetical protein
VSVPGAATAEGARRGTRSQRITWSVAKTADAAIDPTRSTTFEIATDSVRSRPKKTTISKVSTVAYPPENRPP